MVERHHLYQIANDASPKKIDIIDFVDPQGRRARKLAEKRLVKTVREIGIDRVLRGLIAAETAESA
jgi:hypothetical protein